MHGLHRPTRRDWIAGLAAGATLGFLFLGIGARAGMRVVANALGQTPAFTIEGSIAVSLLGALVGALLAAIFLLLRTMLPTRRWTRGALFWIICGALALRGLRPVTTLNAGIFLPLFVMHGVLLHVFWCRVYLPRSRQVDVGAQTVRFWSSQAKIRNEV
jgi:hypothetical protein